jgi:hypothetical protein
LAFRYDWIVLFAHIALFWFSIYRVLRFAWQIAKSPGPEASRS